MSIYTVILALGLFVLSVVLSSRIKENKQEIIDLKTRIMKLELRE